MKDIVLICDDNYYLPTEIMIGSIKRFWNSNENLTIHVLSWQLSKDSIEGFEKLSDKNISIATNIVDSNIYSEKLTRINQNSHVTPTALLKFELANIFSDIDTILYLDSDMICKGSLDEIFDYDLSNHYVAAVYDFWRYLGNKYGDSVDDSFYFNSGVMLLNLDLIRRENAVEKLWTCKFEKYNENKNGKFGLMDQDAFNDVCRNRVVELPFKYNTNNYFTEKSNVKLADLNNYFKVGYQSHRDIIDQALIIHYVGKTDKPWKYLDVPCQQYWDEEFVLSGRKLADLNRHKDKKNIGYILNRIILSVKTRGYRNTILYFYERLVGKIL